MRAGLMDVSSALAALSQKMPAPPAVTRWPRLVTGLVKERGLAARLLRVAPRLGLALSLYARYPEREKDVQAWQRRVARLLDV